MFRNNRQLAEIQDRAKSKSLDAYLQVQKLMLWELLKLVLVDVLKWVNVLLAALGRQMSLQGDALVRHQEEAQFHEDVQRTRGIADRNASL